jgi:hypothetical protein
MQIMRKNECNLLGSLTTVILIPKDKIGNDPNSAN